MSAKTIEKIEDRMVKLRELLNEDYKYAIGVYCFKLWGYLEALQENGEFHYKDEFRLRDTIDKIIRQHRLRRATS